jgi:hypothetical protein
MSSQAKGLSFGEGDPPNARVDVAGRVPERPSSRRSIIPRQDHGKVRPSKAPENPGGLFGLDPEDTSPCPPVHAPGIAQDAPGTIGTTVPGGIGADTRKAYVIARGSVLELSELKPSEAGAVTSWCQEGDHEWTPIRIRSPNWALLSPP